MTADPQPTPTDGPPAGAPPSAGQSLVTSVTMLLIGAGRAAQRRLEGALHEHGITLRHLGALGHLARNAELSYSDLARRASVTVQSMHSTIAGLVALGAIEVETAERGRPARLHLTERGRELLRTAGAVAHDLDATLPRDLVDSPALRAALLDMARPRGT